MHFRVKDTLVTVLPKADADAAGELAKICLFNTGICIHPSIHCPQLSCYHRTCFGCSYFRTCRWCSNYFTGDCGNCSLLASVGCGFLRSCGAGGSACDPTQFCIASEPFVITDIEDLVTLRTELQQTLRRLDEIEKTGLAGGSGITSKAQAEELERSLSEALEQVRAAKKNLK